VLWPLVSLQLTAFEDSVSLRGLIGGEAVGHPQGEAASFDQGAQLVQLGLLLGVDPHLVGRLLGEDRKCR